MKKIFSNVVKVLYPLVLVLLICLFLFSEYTNNIFHLFFAFFAIGLSIAFSPFIYNFATPQRANKVSRIGGAIAISPWAIFALLASVFMVRVSYSVLSVFFWMISFFVISTIVFFFITHIELRRITRNNIIKNNIAKTIAVLRLITLSLWFITSIGMIAMVISLGFASTIKLIDYDAIYVFGKWYASTVATVAFGTLLWGAFSIISFKKIYSDFHFFFYEKENYLLFLRSFVFDKNEKTIELPLKEAGMPILKIGDPKTFFPKGIGDVFYLPSHDWRPQLDYYIKHARYIFSVVDATEGVLWEMFNHMDSMPKFIYYVSDKKALVNIQQEAQLAKFASTALMFCIKKIEFDDSITQCAFCIRGGVCLYSDASTIIQYVTKGIFSSRIKSFDIDINLLDCVKIESEENPHEVARHRSIDKGVKVSRLIRMIFYKSYSGLGKTFGLIITILEVLLGAILIIGGVLYLLNIGFMTDGISEGNRILYGIIAITIGIIIFNKLFVKK